MSSRRLSDQSVELRVKRRARAGLSACAPLPTMRRPAMGVARVDERPRELAGRILDALHEPVTQAPRR